METLIRKIDVCGCEVEIHNFGYAQYYYPSFNGNAEYPVTSKGFRDLSHYIRTVKFHDNLSKEVTGFGIFQTAQFLNII